jgi:radical SAM-linked protein
MASDSQVKNPPSPAATEPRARDKVRLRFRKDGDLALVSHHDLMKCFERAMRRACLPIHVTQGFHPLPRMVFAMPLGLGIIGHCEVLELEFSERIEPGEVFDRLAAQMPPGLEILSVNRIDVRSKAQVRRAGYRVSVPADRQPELPERIAALLAARECWVTRSRPAPRRLNLRPFLDELRLADDRLEMLLWVTPTGAARPGEILELLGLGDLALAGAPLERHILEILDETKPQESLQ